MYFQKLFKELYAERYLCENSINNTKNNKEIDWDRVLSYSHADGRNKLLITLVYQHIGESDKHKAHIAINTRDVSIEEFKLDGVII